MTQIALSQGNYSYCVSALFMITSALKLSESTSLSRYAFFKPNGLTPLSHAIGQCAEWRRAEPVTLCYTAPTANAEAEPTQRNTLCMGNS